jgi:hypothetical protein
MVGERRRIGKGRRTEGGEVLDRERIVLADTAERLVGDGEMEDEQPAARKPGERRLVEQVLLRLGRHGR